MTETPSYPVSTTPHAVVWRNLWVAYAFGPLTNVEESATLCAELHDTRSTGVHHDLGVVWHCRINPPFHLGNGDQAEHLEHDLDDEPAGPLVKGSPRLYDKRGFVIDIFTGDETGADVIGPFRAYTDAAHWWDRQRRWFKPATRAVAISLLAP